MSATFFVYGQDDPDPEAARSSRRPRLITRDFAEALEKFLVIVREEEFGSLEWSS